MTKTEWMIYGANGLTGRQIAEEAVRVGQQPVLAGRSAEKLRPIAEALGLQWVAFDFADRAAAVDALQNVRLLLLAAGPFSLLAETAMDACLESGTHYVDVSNEIPALQAAAQRDLRAREKGIMIVPGVGFGTVASGTVASIVQARMPDAVSLEIAIHIEAKGAGPGTTQSFLEGVRAGGKVRRNGALLPHTLGRGSMEIPFARGARRASPIPTGDLEAAWMDTHIPDITVYGSALRGGFLARVGIAVLRSILWVPGLAKLVGSVEQGTSEEMHCESWARATNARGQSVEATMESGEGYAFTAMSAARAAAILTSAPLMGAHAAVSALGAEFAAQIPGVRITNHSVGASVNAAA